MLFVEIALALSVLSVVLAAPRVETGRVTRAKTTKTFYARSEPVNKDLGIHALFEFFGTEGKSTYIKIHALQGLTTDPSLGGPFPYHIHTNPIPADGNCTKALAHLDPLNVTEGLVCDPAFSEYCQTGDLAGKHGKFNGTETGEIVSFGYKDAFVRFYPQSHSLLGRSVVIHALNKTRLACANITSVLDGTADSSMKPTHKRSSYVKNYPKVAPVQPSPPIIPFNGTTMTDQVVIETFPYPLPVPAMRLDKAANVKLGKITHSVKYNNSEQTITQPKESKSDKGAPFSGV